jgi:hypothetical protein
LNKKEVIKIASVSLPIRTQIAQYISKTPNLFDFDFYYQEDAEEEE